MGLQPVNLNGDVGWKPMVYGLVFFALAALAVALRLVSRRMMKKTLAAEDWMICLALVHFSLSIQPKGDSDKLGLQFLSFGTLMANIVGITS